MKKIKRVLSITLCVLIILTILCTSVFASSPSFPFPNGIQYTSVYSPSANLQSIVVTGLKSRNSDEKQYYSLSSPYSLIYNNVLDGWASGSSSPLFVYPIGEFISLASGNSENFTVANTLTFHSGASGPYALSALSLNSLSLYPELDIVLNYGQSALPLRRVSTNVCAHSTTPFWPSYDIILGNFEGDLDNFSGCQCTLKIKFELDVMGFEYSGDSSGFFFSEAPHLEKISFSETYTIKEFNSSLSEMYGVPIYKIDTFEIYDNLVGKITPLMKDNVHPDELPMYAIIDNMSVSFSIAAHGSKWDPVLFDFTLYDYFFAATPELGDDNDLIEFFPNFVQATEYFSERYPVYKLPQDLSEISFSDFLESVLSVFQVQLFGNFSLSDLLFGVAGIGMLIWFLKMFAGG